MMQQKQKNKREGIAILSVVVVLSTLLIIGVLFAMTVELDLKANKYYREAGRTEMIALEGLYRAIGEIQYDMWGVYEDQAFRLSNQGVKLIGKNRIGKVSMRMRDKDGLDGLVAAGDELAKTWTGEPGAVEAAYFRVHADGQIDETKPIVQPISKWRMSIESIGKNSWLEQNYYKVMTDYRWMVKVEDFPPGAVGEAAAIPRTRRPGDFTGTARDKTLIHSGGMFYDEFLPEHTDNNDAFELGLHLNNGNVYYRNRHIQSSANAQPPRAWMDDYKLLHTDVPRNSQNTKLFARDVWWNKLRDKPWDRVFDYVDTRINGESFYKIFRTDLVYLHADGEWYSTYAGVWSAKHQAANVAGAVAGAPMPKALFFADPAHPDYAHRGRTHTGNSSSWPASAGGGRTSYGNELSEDIDPRGNAVNINPVNNNYSFENYAAFAKPGDTFSNVTEFHYPESKWIFVYNEAGTKKVGRYATFVWPDCGTPNANYAGDDYDWGWSETIWGDHSGTFQNRSLDYFRILDVGYTPVGSPMLRYGERYMSFTNSGTVSENRGVNNIRVNAVNPSLDPNTGPSSNRVDFPFRLAHGMSSHGRDHGPFTSRAELHMALRKNILRDPTSLLPGLSPEQQKEKDVDLISKLLSVHAYENLMGPHYEADRLIIDALGYAGSSVYSGPSKNISGLMARPSSFTSDTLEGKETQDQIWNTLDQLRFYWGPNDDRMGKFTPYRSDLRGINPAADYSKNLFLAWCATGNFDTERSSTPINSDDGNSYGYSSGWGDAISGGWSYEHPSSGGTGFTHNPRTADVDTANEAFALQGAVKINEVGRLDSAKYTSDWGNAQGLSGSYNFVEVMNIYARCTWNGMTRVEDLDIYVGGVLASGGGLRVGPSTSWSLNLNLTTSANPDVAASGNATVLCARRGFKVDASRNGNANYIVYLFPTSFDADSVTLVQNGGIVDFVKLPGNLSQGWSVQDNRANQHPNMWWRTNNDWWEDKGSLSDKKATLKETWATPAFRGKGTSGNVRAPRTGPPTDLGSFRGAEPTWFDGNFSGHWLSGQNANFIYAFLPGAEALPRLVGTYPDPQTSNGSGTPYLGYGIGDQLGYGVINDYVVGLAGGTPNATNWVVAGLQDLAYRTIGTASMSRNFDSWGRLLAVPLAFPPVDSGQGGTNYPDPRLRTWWDLTRLTPAGRYFTTGFLNVAAGKMTPGEWGHYDYIIYDSFDNNQNGQVDELTNIARVGNDRSDWDVGTYDMFVTYKATGHSRGHYMGDRAVIGRVNVNEIVHPAVVWYMTVDAGTGNFWYETPVPRDMNNTVANRFFSMSKPLGDSFVHHNLVIGRKPYKGYTSWVDMETRGVASFKSSPMSIDHYAYKVLFWYENLFADGSSIHSSNGGTHNHISHMTKVMGRYANAGNSPVYTIYVTAQALDVFELPLAEVKVMSTIERTWDGKLNMLDFKWLPSDVRR